MTKNYQAKFVWFFNFKWYNNLVEEFKLRKIKNLEEAKKVFSFISSSIFQEVLRNGDEFVPLHELYESMIDNLVRNKDLQFFGSLGKNIVAAVVSSVLPYDPNCLVINIITVKDVFRRHGFANVLLAELEMIAKRKGFERIRVLYNHTAQHFFKKHNFELLLELAIPESLQIEDVIKINNLALQYKNITKYNNINFVEYKVESADKKIKWYISNNTPLVKASYILEKHFNKKD